MKTSDIEKYNDNKQMYAFFIYTIYIFFYIITIKVTAHSKIIKKSTVCHTKSGTKILTTSIKIISVFNLY